MHVLFSPVQLSLREESNRSESIQFAIGDKIWVLPDKASSTIPKNCGKIEDLPDEFWWVAEVVNCCYLKTPPADSQGDVSPFGFLEVVVSNTSLVGGQKLLPTDTDMIDI
jgi:hypothetical protein